MSTLAFAALTSRREEAPPGTSGSQSPPGVNSYVDAMAALVPAEVLTVHAVILSVTTETSGSTTTITDIFTLKLAFIGLVLLSIFLYIFPRWKSGTLEKFDVVRGAIPPLAFVVWTMLQRTTAFDALYPKLPDAPRTVIAIFAAVILGAIATNLANKADQNPPSGV